VHELGSGFIDITCVRIHSEAEACCVSQVSRLAVAVVHLGTNLTLVHADDCKGTVGPILAVSWANCEVSVSRCSDGLGTAVKDEPLVKVPWTLIMNSELELLGVQSLVPVESPLVGHLADDSELKSVLEGVLLRLQASFIKVPGLV